MNASRLREIAELLLKREAEYSIQSKLDAVNSPLSQLVAAPHEAVHQQNVAGALTELRDAASQMAASFEPAQIDLFEDIGADEYFSTDFPANIQQQIQENAATPAVAQQNLQEFLGNRATYLAMIEQLVAILEGLGIEVNELEEGDAEVGFLIPRALFGGQLDQFIKQLGIIQRIIRAFSEAATGSAETVELRQISSTDPLLFLGLTLPTIIAIGQATNWALATWKKVEDIRKIRAETKKLEVFSEDDIKIFDDKIQKTIEQEIEAQVTEIIGVRDGKAGRGQEQRIDMAWALKTMLALVERGVKIEIRALTPASQAEEEAAEGDQAKTAATIKTLDDIKSRLIFPRVEGPPVLELPSQEPPKTQKKDKQQED